MGAKQELEEVHASSATAEEELADTQVEGAYMVDRFEIISQTVSVLENMIIRIQKLHPNLKIAQQIHRPFVLSQDCAVQEYHLKIVHAQSATFDITCCN